MACLLASGDCLWGTASNLHWLETLIREEHAASASPSLRVLNSRVNESNLTYDGVDICGSRVASLVQDTVASFAAEGEPVTHISFVGYSLGGLYNRYAIGKLWSDGFFDTVQPLNFFTIATPHVGSWQDPVTRFARVLNYLLPTMGSRSGTQLMLQDSHAWGKPLLCLMAQPELPFMKALGSFKKLMLMANVQNDNSVPYCTASISSLNPFIAPGAVFESYNPKFPSLVRVVAPQSRATTTHLHAHSEPTPTNATITLTPTDKTRSPPTLSHSNHHSPSHSQAAVQQPSQQKVNVLFPLFVPLLGVFLLKGILHQREWDKRSEQQDSSWLVSWLQLETVAGATTGIEQSKVMQQQQQQQQQEEERGKQRILEAVPSVEHVPVRDVVLTILGEQDGRAVSAEAETRPLGAAGKHKASAAVGLQADCTHGAGLLAGMPNAPVEVRTAWEWQISQLNTLPWNKIDVDCRHYHAHAAVILRTPSRFMDNRDVMDYFVDQMILKA
ncbi:MAG: hypothetical protein WDW38_002717 [Sanguina aurantia]